MYSDCWTMWSVRLSNGTAADMDRGGAGVIFPGKKQGRPATRRAMRPAMGRIEQEEQGGAPPTLTSWMVMSSNACLSSESTTPWCNSVPCDKSVCVTGLVLFLRSRSGCPDRPGPHCCVCARRRGQGERWTRGNQCLALTCPRESALGGRRWKALTAVDMLGSKQERASQHLWRILCTCVMDSGRPTQCFSNG